MSPALPDAAPADLPAPVVWTRAAAVGSLGAMIVLGLLWELWIAPLRPGGSWWALKVVPLLFPLAGLLRNRMYTYRWVSLLVWLYFTEAVVRVTTEFNLSGVMAGIQLVLCLVLFTACAVHVRWRLAHAHRTAAPAEPAA